MSKNPNPKIVSQNQNPELVINPINPKNISFDENFIKLQSIIIKILARIGSVNKNGCHTYYHVNQ